MFLRTTVGKWPSPALQPALRFLWQSRRVLRRCCPSSSFELNICCSSASSECVSVWVPAVLQVLFQQGTFTFASHCKILNYPIWCSCFSRHSGREVISSRRLKNKLLRRQREKNLAKMKRFVPRQSLRTPSWRWCRWTSSCWHTFSLHNQHEWGHLSELYWFVHLQTRRGLLNTSKTPSTSVHWIRGNFSIHLQSWCRNSSRFQKQPCPALTLKRSCYPPA